MADAPRARERSAPSSPGWMSRGELGKVMGDVSKAYGPTVINRADLRPKLKHIPMGVFTLDMATLGGIPEGACTLKYGRAHSGKTTLTLRAIGQAQKKYPDRTPALIDLEGTYAPEWGEVHGIDNSRLALVQPDTGEQALDVVVELLKAQEVSMVAVDSLAGLVPFKETQKSFEDAMIGEQARLISRFCRVAQNIMLNQRKRGHRPAIVLVNQWRYKVGVMYGDPRVLPGGEAQHYFASLKIEYKNKEKEGKDDNNQTAVLHNEHAFSIDKNKIGAAVREGEFQMIRDPDHPLGQGFIDDGPAVVTWMRGRGLITGGGSSWKVQELGDRKFGRLQEIADHFYSDLAYYDDLKRRLITDYRVSRGLSADWW